MGRVRPSTVKGRNEGANTLFDTVDVLFGTVDREDVGNEEGANLLLLPPLWSALLDADSVTCLMKTKKNHYSEGTPEGSVAKAL